MQYITSTELRTKSKSLIKYIKSGGRTKLIHRSKVIAKIEPTYEAKPITKADIKELNDILKSLVPKGKRIPRSKRERVYRERLMKEYGKGLS